MAVQQIKTGHVGLNVSDLDRSRDFYQQVFGFRVIGESWEAGRRYAFLGTESELVVTLWQQSEGRFEKTRPGLHHLAFQVADIQQVRAAEERLRALGVTPLHDGIVPHAEGAQSGGIFFEDPDGIRLEIYSPTGADERPVPDSHGPTCGFF